MLVTVGMAGGGGKTECGQTDSCLLYQDWRSFQSGSKARSDVEPRKRAEHTYTHVLCLVWSIGPAMRMSFSWSHGWLQIYLRLCRSLMYIRDLCRAWTVSWKQKQTAVRRFSALCTHNDFLMGLLILLWFKPQNNRTWRMSSQEAVSAVRPHRHRLPTCSEHVWLNVPYWLPSLGRWLVSCLFWSRWLWDGEEQKVFKWRWCHTERAKGHAVHWQAYSVTS